MTNYSEIVTAGRLAHHWGKTLADNPYLPAEDPESERSAYAGAWRSGWQGAEDMMNENRRLLSELREKWNKPLAIPHVPSTSETTEFTGLGL